MIVVREEPWISPDAVLFIDAWIKSLPKKISVFEWGSGGSTAWFASRSSELVSIEHDPDWAAAVSKRLGDDIDHRVILAPNGMDYERTIDPFPFGHFELVFVDGIRRPECLRRIENSIRVGGLLVLDDSQRYGAAIGAMSSSLQPIAWFGERGRGFGEPGRELKIWRRMP